MNASISLHFREDEPEAVLSINKAEHGDASYMTISFRGEDYSEITAFFWKSGAIASVLSQLQANIEKAIAQISKE
jgi:hypothetical protein